ncbi:MAG TPA: DNA recombination protein RmuC, partial [Candidatus Kryptonia bacterium]|nr:DNA recombination protein RmuC [Candidatus Kryptonia bacterium]
MDASAVVAGIAAGLVAGAFIVWSVTRLRSAPQLAATAVLTERLSAREREVEAAQAAGAQIEQELAQARARIIELTARQSELSTTLEHERQLAAEKLAQIENLTRQLTDTFKALSSDALRSNNQSFLELAKATLEKFQSEAQGDLVQRQKAVETLIAPIKESLEKVDAQIQTIEQTRQHAYGTLSE